MFSTQPQRKGSASPMRALGQTQRPQSSKALSLSAASRAGGLASQQSQSDWEKEIESLDQKEVELHQTQMKMIRGQMSNLLQELGGLREEVNELRLQREADKVEVQAFHEELQRDKEDTQTELMALIEALQEDNKGHTSRLDEVAALVGDGMQEDRMNENHAELENRLAMLHQAHGDTVQQHAKELADLRDSHNAHTARFNDHAKQAQAHHATVPERLAYLEKMLGDSADQHSAKLEAALSKVDKLHSRVADLGKNHDSMAKDKEEKHATLQERVDYIESMIGDSADKHAQEVQALKAAHDKHAAAMSKHGKFLDDHKGAMQGHHASLQERIDGIEQILGVHADKHGEGLSEVSSKFDNMLARLNAVERYGSVLDELKRSHSNLARQKEELAGNHSLLTERLDGLHQTFSENFDTHGSHLQDLRSRGDKHIAAMSKHAKDLEALRAEKQAIHESLSSRLDGIEQAHGETAERYASGLSDVNTTAQAVLDRLAGVEKHGKHIGDLQRSHDALAAKKQELESSHATMGERVSYLEQMLGDSIEKHADQLRELRDSHSKHKSDIDGLRGLHAKHSTVDERLDYLEQLLGDSADKHLEELSELRRSHDALHGRLSAAESHGPALNELRKSHGGLAAQKSQLEAHHASLKERVDYLEQLLNDSADKHAEKVDAAHAKLTDMHGRLSACERFGPTLADLKRGHSEMQDSRRALDSDTASIKDRLDSMEALFGDSTNRHSKELKNLKALQDKHGSMLTKHASSLDGFSHHATLPERMAYIEQQLGDSADKHNAELSALHKKVAQEQAARERHHGSVKDMLAREQEERGNHHASLNERVDYLESVIGDTADKHARELAQIASGHQKLHGELKSRGDVHATMADRVSKLEQAHADMRERHAQDLKAHASKIEAFNSRFSVVKEAWGQDTPRR